MAVVSLTASADVYLIISSGSQCDDDEISSNTRYANFGASPSTYIPPASSPPPQTTFACNCQQMKTVRTIQALSSLPKLFGTAAPTSAFAATPRRRRTAATSSTPRTSDAWNWRTLSQGGKAELLSLDAGSDERDAFVAACREEYVANGWCHIPFFLPTETIQAMKEEARALLESDVAFESTEMHTVYQEEQDGSLPAQHPRNRLMASQKKIVDFARVAPSSPLKALYGMDELLQFVQHVVGVPRLHHSACPFNAAMYNGYYDGHGLGWHFDRSKFGVNLVLAEPDDGGTFDYHRNTRDENDAWAYDTVREILASGSATNSSSMRRQPIIPGEDDARQQQSTPNRTPRCNLQQQQQDEEWKALGVETVRDVSAGSLVFFSGRNSLHRVSPVVGKEPRINCILTYEEKPGQKANAYSLQKFFGRTAEEQARSLAT